MRHITLVIAVVMLAVAAPAVADKGGNGNGGGNSGGNGGGSGSEGEASPQKPAPYSPTLSVSWPDSTRLSTEVPYVIEGCGYDASYGTVTVVVYSPASAGWTGRDPDAGGCISVSNFQTQGSGTYRVEAWQHMKNRNVVVASTSFTL